MSFFRGRQKCLGCFLVVILGNCSILLPKSTRPDGPDPSPPVYRSPLFSLFGSDANERIRRGHFSSYFISSSRNGNLLQRACKRRAHVTCASANTGGSELNAMRCLHSYFLHAISAISGKIFLFRVPLRLSSVGKAVCLCA